MDIGDGRISDGNGPSRGIGISKGSAGNGITACTGIRDAVALEVLASVPLVAACSLKNGNVADEQTLSVAEYPIRFAPG